LNAATARLPAVVAALAFVIAAACAQDCPKRRVITIVPAAPQ
jgi:tripartite-type tricarboxylate transporter receptor subunit TctC